MENTPTPSEETPLVGTLILRCTNAQAVLTVRDSEQNEVASGIGRVEVTGKPGPYHVRVSVSNREREETVFLQAGAHQERRIPAPPWRFRREVEILGIAGIGFLGLLVAVLFPIMRPRESAKSPSCLSNLKQVMLAELMYAQDYDETYAPTTIKDLAGTPGGPPSGGGDCAPDSKISWRSLTQPYIKNWQVYHCPQNPTNNQRSDDANPNAWRSYARNARVFGAGLNRTGISLASLNRPGTTMQLLETTWSCADLGDWVARTTDPSACSWGTAFYQHQGAIQGGKATQPNGGQGNWAYADGHAKAAKMSQLLTPYEENHWLLVPTIEQAKQNGSNPADTAEFTARDLCILYR